jgi:ubiquinone/menaquinone biosynthesis C-methylase UbiE
MIPPQCRRILDLGCGAGDWTARIAEIRPDAYVTGIDVGEDFIAAARRRHRACRVEFGVEDFAALSFADGAFDCVYADNSLEHAFDVDRTLGEIRRVLCDGGVLVAALPSDARNSGRTCDNHTWKTAPHEVRMRLEAAGFTDLSVEEVDAFRRLGMPPYPPSDDRMMYVRASRPG